MTSFNKVHWSSVSYNWDTPIQIFLDLHKEFNFNLDPTDRPIGGLPGLKDGLRMKHPKGSVEFINPPYERGLIYSWVSKVSTEMNLGRVDLAVWLIPLRNSDYFKLLRKKNAEFRLCEKRLKFGDADNSSSTNGNHGAPFDSVVAIQRKQN